MLIKQLPSVGHPVGPLIISMWLERMQSRQAARPIVRAVREVCDRETFKVRAVACSYERWLPIDSRNLLRQLSRRFDVQVLILILLVVAAFLRMEGRFFREHPAASVVPHHVTSPPVGNDGGSDVVLTSNERPRVNAAASVAATSVPADDPATVIAATVTTYQADPAQTDCEPCKTASGVDACHPPYPIVANNGLAFGTKVRIRGTTYVVADRMASRYGRAHFDVLTQGENYSLKTEPVEIL